MIARKQNHCIGKLLYNQQWQGLTDFCRRDDATHPGEGIPND